MSNTIIYGNGAMARVVYSYARHTHQISAFTVDDACIAAGETSFMGLPLLPFSRIEQHCSPQTHQMLIAMGFIDMNGLRLRKYAEAKAKGYAFTRYIHPAMMLHEGVEIGENSIVLDFVSLHAGCKLGHSSFISSNVNLGHDCVLEPGNWINAGVSIAGGCTLKTGSFLGVNASLGHGVTLGAHNFIAANTLVTQSTEDEAVYLSEPGQRFKLGSRAFLRFAHVLG